MGIKGTFRTLRNRSRMATSRHDKDVSEFHRNFYGLDMKLSRFTKNTVSVNFYTAYVLIRRGY